MLALVLLAAATFVGTLVVPLASILRGPTIVAGRGFLQQRLDPDGTVALGGGCGDAAGPLAGFADGRREVVARGRRGRWRGCRGDGLPAGRCGIPSRWPWRGCQPGPLRPRWPPGSSTHAGWLALTPGYPRGASPGGRGEPLHPAPSAGCLPSCGSIAGSRRAGHPPRLRGMLAVGVTGSSLGSRSHEATMRQGEVVHWGGYSIRCLGLSKRDLPDALDPWPRTWRCRKAGAMPYPLAPAGHLHRRQTCGRTGVAIHSRWDGDFYAILRGEVERGKVDVTFQQNPMMRWMWASGWMAAAGAGIGLWPPGRRRRTGVSGTLRVPPGYPLAGVGTRSVPDTIRRAPHD